MKEDIKDNEIRVIGLDSGIKPNGIVRLLGKIIISILLIITAVTAVYFISSGPSHPEPEIGIYDPTPEPPSDAHPLCAWLSQHDSLPGITGCAIKDTLVNDIMVRIYLPVNARPALCIGTRPLNDDNVILAFQAADIRADNKKIVGAFVEKGKPLAWGLSKKGYCAILHDSIYIGMADNTSLFEQATDCDGYFFRQYPLVSNHIPQSSELKTQTIRRALCEAEGRTVVIETHDRAGMHDFAVLLADLGVSNAIYLIGSDAMGTVTDLSGNRTTVGDNVKKRYKNINFIYWTKAN